MQTKTTKYVPLIRPTDKPAIWLNKERMEKYRPEMKKYYYDPTRYKNYLDQLGIKYPTTVKPRQVRDQGSGMDNRMRVVKWSAAARGLVVTVSLSAAPAPQPPSAAAAPRRIRS